MESKFSTGPLTTALLGLSSSPRIHAAQDFFERQSKYATQDQKAFEKAIMASRSKTEPKDSAALEQVSSSL